jgi:hypothetical protein
VQYHQDDALFVRQSIPNIWQFVVAHVCMVTLDRSFFALRVLLATLSDVKNSS